MGAAGYGIDRWLHIVYITWGDTVVVYIWCLRVSKDRAYDCGYFLMNNVAVRVENLSKLYRIGARQVGTATLRESVKQLAASPFRYLVDTLRPPSDE